MSRRVIGSAGDRVGIGMVLGVVVVVVAVVVAVVVVIVVAMGGNDTGVGGNVVSNDDDVLFVVLPVSSTRSTPWLLLSSIDVDSAASVVSIGISSTGGRITK